MGNKIKKAPIEFTPYFKEVIWGGNSLKDYKNVQNLPDKIGESWEISEVPGYESVVSSGEYKGKNLSQLISEFGENLLGSKVLKKYNGKFPLLIKFIDAADNLSLQVHPDDKLAKERHNSLGKTEMWYIVKTAPNAKIISGFKKEISPDEYEKSVKDGSFMETVAEHDALPGDVFFLPAGRVHGIGAGNLLAEIQETSDITYRIFDYNRKDANGKPRELHIDAAKDAIDFKVYDNYKNSTSGDQSDFEVLVESEHFKTCKIIVNGEKKEELPEGSFTILICVEGEAEVICEEGSSKIERGKTLLLPADVREVAFKGKATLLKVDVNI